MDSNPLRAGPVFGPLYPDLGMNKVSPPACYQATHRIFIEIVMQHLSQLLSKQSTATYLTEDLNASTSLAAIYRIMDQLDETRIE